MVRNGSVATLRGKTGRWPDLRPLGRRLGPDLGHWIKDLRAHLLVVRTVSTLSTGEENGHGRKNQGKTMENHRCQRAKKTVMNQADKEKTIVANGVTPRQVCDSTATGKERERESGAAGSNEATELKPNGGLEADRTRGLRLNLSCKLKMKRWDNRKEKVERAGDDSR